MVAENVCHSMILYMVLGIVIYCTSNSRVILFMYKYHGWRLPSRTLAKSNTLYPIVNNGNMVEDPMLNVWAK